MKAAVLLDNEKIEVQDIDLGPLSDDKIRVEVISCGICGSDIPRYFSHGAHFYPLILGHEYYGKVKEVGKNITSFKVGDDVVGIPLVPCFECPDCKIGNYSLCSNYKFMGSSLNGAYAEMIDVKENNIFKIDSKVASPYCALFEPSAVALHAIMLFDTVKDKTVAVVGGGTIGSLLAIWCKIKGASKVCLYERNLDNVETYEKLGIKEVYVSNDEGLEASKRNNNVPEGFDFVFDAAGTNPTILFSLKAIKKKGNFCLVGTPTSQVTFTVKEWETINRKEITIKGSWMCYSSPFPGKEWEETNAKLISGELKFTEDYFAAFYKLEEATKAFEFIKKGKDGKIGRICLLNK